VKDAPLLHELRKEALAAGRKSETFNQIWAGFTKDLLRDGKDEILGEGPVRKHLTTGSTYDPAPPLLARLRQAFTTRGQTGLDDRLKHEFYAHLINPRFTASDTNNQRALADLRYPSEWFPATRAIQRQIHLHVGPTNSGKTYQALKRLETAQVGVYAGPLRLLAHEVYSRMNAKGIKCSLVTGEERRLPADLAADGSDGQGLGNMSACTVEMMPLNRDLDVAVIDEIQMIGSFERGWAWTQALLGVKAREVHLCGEERTVPLIRELCASLGDHLEIHRYERLSPLEVAPESLDGDLGKLRKGDCVVSFSVMGIHSLRRQIERATGKKVATVYGSLPPETRAQQARLFNDPSNDYDFLVASDAVGMGLNLAIKRIVFEASSKFDGYKQQPLAVADIKQIAGRAGRYRIASQVSEQPAAGQDLSAGVKVEPPAGTAPPAVTQTPAADAPPPPPEPETTGIVTTLQTFDFPQVAAAMTSQPEPILTAGLFPPAPVLERFASYFPPGTPFSYILTRLHELSQMHSRFHLCGLKDQVWIADLIEPVQGLTIGDRNVICSVPASSSDRELWGKLMPAYAKCIAEQSGGALLDIPSLPLELLDAPMSASRTYLRELELLHKGIVAYQWLSYRFAGVFGQRALAFHTKGLVEAKIEECLGSFSFSAVAYEKVREARERALKEAKAAEAAEMMKKVDEVVEKAKGEEEAVVGEVEGLAPGAVAALEAGDTEGGVAGEGAKSLATGGDVFGGETGLGFEEALEEEQGDLTTAPVSAPDERDPTSVKEEADVLTQAALEHRHQADSEAEHSRAHRARSAKAKVEVEVHDWTLADAAGSRVPTKHLSAMELEKDGTELERNVAARP